MLLSALRQALTLCAIFSTMLKFIGTIFILELIACNQRQSEIDTKILDFGLFTIETPRSWTKVNAQGFDSYAGDIAIDNSDTLSFDLGWYSDNLTEYERFEPYGKSYYISRYDTSRTSPLLDSTDMVKLLKSNVTWDTIDGKLTKVLTPRISGIGITGIYIDSLWQAGPNTVRFNLYATNLKSSNEKEALKAFRTLKFHKK